jgi:hypothetical protein
MGGMTRHNSPIGAPSSPKPAKARFPDGDAVTGIFRPLTNDEHWTLYYFESHAAKCKSCHEPLRVSKQGRKLCNAGHELAIDVVGLIFRANDGKIYSRQESHRNIRVELPGDYVETVSLLKAIQRGIRKEDHFAMPKSHDKSYYVADRRIPERFATTPEPAPRFETRVPGQWSEHQNSHSRHNDPLRRFPHLQRGSHYGADMGELARAMKIEQRLHYNVELRVPNYLPSSRRSSIHIG